MKDSFYDDERAVQDYLAHRHAAISSPNIVMEEPAFTTEAGELVGLRVLDLGCGDGSFGRVCVQTGCASYLGIDGSAIMIDRAREAVRSDRARFEVVDLADFVTEPASFDLVASRMALHYVRDVGPVLDRAYGALAEGGRLIFSVVHPVVTSRRQQPEGQRTTVLVDEYFESGDRERQWFGRDVTWQHRSIEDYVSAVHDAGFTLTSLRECEPVESLFHGDRVEYGRRRRIPLFLLISARV